MKVTVVGSGNVGATAANVLATKGFASEVVLIDIKEGLSEVYSNFFSTRKAKTFCAGRILAGRNKHNGCSSFTSGTKHNIYSLFSVLNQNKAFLLNIFLLLSSF